MNCANISRIMLYVISNYYGNNYNDKRKNNIIKGMF